MRPFMDKDMPDAWQAAVAFGTAIGEAAKAQGLTTQESELIKLRASQMNGCVYCLDLHSRKAREAGVDQQKLDILPAWRETDLFDDREQAVLAIAEAATRLPLSEESMADLFGARTVLGDEVFVAAEWVASTINTFNRISILSQHPVRRREPSEPPARGDAS